MVLLVVLLLLALFVDDLLVLDQNLLGEVSDVLGHASEFLLEFSDFILCVQQLLRVQVSVRPDAFVQVLLLLEPSLSLNVLLLQLLDEVVLELDLLQTLVVLGVRLRSFDAILLFVLLQLVDQFH